MGLLIMTTTAILQEAKKRLQEIFEKYKDSGDMAPIGEVFDVTECGCNVANLVELMREIDPARKVFETPVTRSEKGLFNLPLFTNHIVFCSSVYGTETSVIDQRIPDDFVELVEHGFNHGDLHGAGFLIWHETENTHGFLVTETLEDGVKPNQAEMESLSSRLGAKVACYSDPAHDKHAKVCLTVLLTKPDELNSVASILNELSDLAEQWYADTNN